MPDPFDRVLRAAARRGRTAGVCPEADVLASYVDAGLSAAERDQVEAHAADCPACQRHLALLGAVSVGDGSRATRASSFWLPRWGWLVPVATAVLVVAVWTRMPERESAPEPLVSREAPIEDAMAAPPADVPAAPPAEGGRSFDTRAGSSEDKAPAAKARVRDHAGAPAVAAPLSRQAPTPAAVAPEAPRALADAAGQERENEARETLGRSEATAMQKAAGPPAFAAAASPTEAYRASGGRVERSADGGATWAEAFADTQLSFSAAACAPGGPCWFGTTTGVILRTGAGGLVRSRLPVNAPVTAISPGAGLEATVTAGAGRFHTADGLTWAEMR